MKKEGLLLAVMLGLTAAGCNEVPESVKKTNPNADSVVEIRREGLSEMNLGIDEVREHLKKRGYESKFRLAEDIELYGAEKLYELELESVSGISEKFPELYNAVFGRDFKADSGVESVEGLPRVSEAGADVSGFINFDTNVNGFVAYYKARNSSIRTDLEVTDIGFIGWNNEYQNFDSAGIGEGVCPYSGTFKDAEFRMSGGGTLSVSEAAGLTEAKAREVFGMIDRDFQYRTKKVTPLHDSNGKTVYKIQLEKTFEGVPFNSLDFGGYEPGDTRIKSMYYDAEVQSARGPEHLAAQWGFERIISKKELTGELISLPAAFDLLNNVLAPEIQLDITEIRLVYAAQFKAPDADELQKRVKNSGCDYGVLSQEERLILGEPEMTPGRKFLCRPMWQFIMEYPQEKNAEGYYTENASCDCIMVDAVTGEVFDFFKRVYTVR